MKRTSFLGVSSRRSCRSSQNCSNSASSALLVGAQTWITVILNGLPWKRIEITLSFLRLHPSSAFQTFVDYDGYSISSVQRSSIQSAKTRSGAECGSDHDILIAKFRLKLKKIGKTTRSFRYILNQFPYDYTVEVRNRFKRLDLIDRVHEELWTEVHDIVQEAGIKIIPRQRNSKGKMVV